MNNNLRKSVETSEMPLVPLGGTLMAMDTIIKRTFKMKIVVHMIQDHSTSWLIYKAQEVHHKAQEVHHHHQAHSTSRLHMIQEVHHHQDHSTSRWTMVQIQTQSQALSSSGLPV